MEYERFKDIIMNNRMYDEEVKETLDEFRNRINLSNPDIPKLIKEIGKKLGITIIEIPIKDSEFGVIYFCTSYSKYLLLNSNQPRNKMYFAFCHDLYHVLKGSTNFINEKREVHFNKEYTIDPLESKANLFAANLLMPDVQFTKMYRLYSSSSLNLEEVILKLMNYFNSSVIAVLIRLFELQLLKNTKDVNGFLSINDIEIGKKLKKLWISDEIVKPTLNDEMDNVFDLIEKEGHKCIKSGFLSEYEYQMITNRLYAFYKQIVKGKDEQSIC